VVFSIVAAFMFKGRRCVRTAYSDEILFESGVTTVLFQPNAMTVDTHISKNSIDSSLSNLSG